MRDPQEEPPLTADDIMRVIDDVLNDVEQIQWDMHKIQKRLQASEEKLLDLSYTLEQI